MLHSIYDLTTSCRKTTGDVPAKLVGASTTVVGSAMYLFGGRQVAERKMVSDMYRFDLDTLVWTRIPPDPNDDVPCSRYFHSSDAWGNYLIIFGGMSNQPDSPNPDELCVLNDVRLFDLETNRWLPPAPDNGGDAPRARYAHLSSVTSDRLFIIGGQDFYNTWLDDVCVYDLLARTWVQRRDYPRHCGTYRSVAVASDLTVRYPNNPQINPRFNGSASSSADSTPPDALVFHPYSAAPTEDQPAPIFLYSNYNFTDVKRELEVFSPLPDTDFTIADRSGAMTGTTFPPGLRFPTGAVLGTHLIIAGTYLAHSYQSFSIWVLDLQTMQWSRIDPGKAVETGSWFRGCLAPQSNKFYIFGNRDGNLVDDYNRRLLSWEHVAIVDLEAFGIYQPPPAKVDIGMQELGLSALEEGILADFDFVCEDGRKIGVSRRLIEERWPWFRDQRRKMLDNAMQVVEGLPTSPMHVDLPSTHRGADPRLSPRTLHLSEAYPITLALAQYFYAQALITPLQQAPAVLSQLLILATNYQITHLEQLVKHAMHRALSNSTSVGVYEVATLCNCRSLQIRALKTVMSYTQKRPGNKPKEGRGPPPPPNTDSNLHGGGESYSRPRGTSDAKWRTMGNSGGDTYGNGDRHGRQVQSRPPPLHQYAASSSSTSEDDEPAPLPLFKPHRRRHQHTFSNVSVDTDEALRDVADLLAPTISPGAADTQCISSRRDSARIDIHPFDDEEYEIDGLRVFIPSLDTRSSHTAESTAPSLLSASSTSSQTSSRGPPTPGMSSYTDDQSFLPSPIQPSFVPNYSYAIPTASNRSSRTSSRGPTTPSFDHMPPHVEDQDVYSSSPTQSPRQGPYAYAASNSTSASELELVAWPKQKSTIEWVTSRASVQSNTTAMAASQVSIMPIPSIPSKKGFKSFFGSKHKNNEAEERDLKEQKQRKAAEKRLRTDRLAEDLRARAEARKRAYDNMSVTSSERKKAAVANMFGGVAGGGLVM